MPANEIDLGKTRHGYEGADDERELLWTALDAAQEQNQVTWVLYNGRRIAAVVPVEVAEAAEEAARDQLQDNAAGASEGAWVEAPDCRLLGHAQHDLNAIIERPDPDKPHAHWCGDLRAGHHAFMQVSAGLRRAVADAPQA